MESKTNYKISDSELIYQINDNNEDAKNYLFQKYSPLIHKEVQKYTKEASIKGIEYKDLLQEGMLAFSEAINSFDEKENVKFITFATLCIKRRIINLLKKQSTNKEQILNNYLPLEAELIPQKKVLDIVSDLEGKEPLNKLIVDESLKEVSENILNNLKPKEKTVYLDYLNGKKIEDISKDTGISTKTIYNIIYRVKQKIKLVENND